MLIKLSVAHLLGLASILTATTIAGSTPVKAAEMAVHPMSQATIASPNKSGVPVSKKVSKNTLVDVASANGSFKTLTAALKAAGLVETLKGPGPFTVFAPTDAAFAKLPKGTVETLLKPENKAQLVKILTYHVVSGEVLSTTLKSGKVKTVEGGTVNVSVHKNGVTINKSKVTAVDVKASNGVIHVIDTVLMPPVESATNTLVDVASANGSFKTLTAALKAAGLVDTLKGPGPFTVFAPTDAAFAKLPKGTVEALLKPENKAQLVKILTYHVVPGEVLSTTLKSGKVKTVEGGTVNVSVHKNGVTINKSKVTAVDVKASNGVIHVIDTVLMPSAR
jgi:transforming growth factor-beta-induced protein